MAVTTDLAAQNDDFRRTMGCYAPGRVLLTRSVAALEPLQQAGLLMAVRTFTAFTPDNDPHGEHDFGAVQLDGTRYFWKIDYYEDASCIYGAERPAEACYRVLTLMEASEY
jgi:hypothetical protein